MQRYLFPASIAVLAATALLLGFFILQPMLPDRPDRPQQIGDPSLSTDEQRVLNTPTPDSSEDERREHFELAARLAEEAPFLDITQCTVARPVVFKVRQGQEFTVRNDDGQEHVLILDQDHAYPVPAGGEIELTADFDKGPGLYGFGCDAVPHAVGLFLVEPDGAAQ